MKEGKLILIPMFVIRITLYLLCTNWNKLSRYHVIHCQVLMRFTINYSSIYLMTVCYCFCIFVITFGCLGIFRLHGGLRLLCLWVRVGCSRTLLVTGLLPLLAVFVKQWGWWWIDLVPRASHGCCRVSEWIPKARICCWYLVILETSIGDAFLGRGHLVSFFWGRLWCYLEA